MAFGEKKYTNLKADGLTLLEDEPYFLLRGKDLLAPAILNAYAASLEAAAYGLNGLPPEVFRGEREEEAAIEVAIEEKADELRVGAKLVEQYADTMREWQASHAELCQLPD